MFEDDPFGDRIPMLAPPTPWQVARYLAFTAVFLVAVFGGLVWSLCGGMI